MSNENLTNPQYWDSSWDHVSLNLHRGRLKRWLLEQQADRQFWKQIVPKSIGAAQNPKLIELGSAPGRNLLPWFQLGYSIYGADFSDAGLMVQRGLFSKLGLSEDHTIKADFLDPGFQRQYSDAFDIVYSAGLIEHFTDPREAVQAHLALLRKDGTLIVSVPNLCGVYKRLLPKAIVDVHNTGIMNVPAFRSLFSGVQEIFCGYYGGLNLGIAFGEGTGPVYKLLPGIQIAANVLSRVAQIPDNRITSPYLLFVGRK